ncbi:MAG TPA: B-box zinc finger protein, partial [Pyrinomonadaceae bacterium]
GVQSAPSAPPAWTQKSPADDSTQAFYVLSSEPAPHEAHEAETPPHAHDPWDSQALPHAPAAACQIHPERAPKFVCRSCGASLCDECAMPTNGTRIQVCALCGYFCRPYAEAAASRAHYEHRQEGFGLSDFTAALKYPFTNVVSLIFGAGLYGGLLFGGFKGQILAYAIMFGCLSIVIGKVAYGKLKEDFLPDFSTFSAYDDLFMPLLLGAGATAVTIGPTLVLLVALVFGLFGGHEEAIAEAIPAAQERSARAEAEFTVEDAMALAEDREEALKQEERRAKVEEIQAAAQAERTLREPGVVRRIYGQVAARPGLIALLLVLSLVWAFFYYPMAIAVAGYTEDIWSVVNPSVGLDTISRMGVVYVKAFLMYAAVQLLGLVAGAVVGVVTAPFDLPYIGNLPATFIEGALTFYLNLVIACILGLALFKSADRVGIEMS